MELHNIPRDAGPVQKSSGIAERQPDMPRVIHFPKRKKENEGFRKVLNEEIKKESVDIEKSVMAAFLLDSLSILVILRALVDSGLIQIFT